MPPLLQPTAAAVAQAQMCLQLLSGVVHSAPSTASWRRARPSGAASPAAWCPACCSAAPLIMSIPLCCQ